MIEEYSQEILAIDPMTPECLCNYPPWDRQFRQNSEVHRCIEVVKRAFPRVMTRRSIIEFFRRKGRDAELAKFLAVMIWGYGADEEGRADNRGPWRVEQMTSKLRHLREVLCEAKRKISDGDLGGAYKCFGVQQCGTSFRSKYFYFVGKSLGIKRYPLIFDNRVAVGLARIWGLNSDLLAMVSIQTKGTASAYVQYTNLLHEKAAQMKCEADQIELFLFDHAGNL